MDKKNLKKILKPLMKECVKELLMEEGMIKVLSEVMTPKQQSGQLDEHQLQNVKKTYPQGTILQDPQEAKIKIEETRKKMLEEIGKSGYLNGVNPFEGTQPLSEAQAPEKNPSIVSRSQRMPPAMNNFDPNDPGVNIKGIMSLAGGRWKTNLNKG